MIWLDAYERRARLAPGLLVVLPVAFVVSGFGLRNHPVVSLAASLLGAAGLSVLLASTVRDQGLKVQNLLVKQWGGWPTTVCLRHRGDPSQARRREQWRKNVSEAIDRALPSADDEVRDSVDADDRYETAVAEVRELARDRAKFPLVFAETRNFGFERNLLGMRPAGVIVAGAACIVLVAGLVLASAANIAVSIASVAIALLVSVALLAIWIWVPTEQRVRRVGFRYAERLLDSAGRIRNERAPS